MSWLLKIDQPIEPFLMSVAIGASCAFLSPIGHQCNTLVMAPGNYKFGDDWRPNSSFDVRQGYLNIKKRFNEKSVL